MRVATEYLRDETGASASEYALILALIGLGTALAVATFGRQLVGAYACAPMTNTTQTRSTPE